MDIAATGANQGLTPTLFTQALPIRTVVFTGGPELGRQVIEFLERLENNPHIELVGIFSQSPHRGISGMVRDLWNRRRLLVIPLMLQTLCRSIYSVMVSPRQHWHRRKLLRKLRPRTHYVRDIHGTDVIARVKDLDPQLGLVYGGPIIKRRLFEIPVQGTLGIHHGKLPEYRGKKTTFWALNNGEEEVGVTIQRIGPRLDGGDIVMQELLPVAKQPPPRVKKQLEKVGLALYICAIHAIREGSATYTAQPNEPAIL